MYISSFYNIKLVSRNIFSAQEVFFAKTITTSHASTAPQTNRQGIGAWCLLLICYLQPAMLIADKYPKNDEHDAIGSIKIIKRQVKRVTWRDKLYVVMKHQYLQYEYFLCVESWVRLEK